MGRGHTGTARALTFALQLRVAAAAVLRGPLDGQLGADDVVHALGVRDAGGRREVDAVLGIDDLLHLGPADGARARVAALRVVLTVEQSIAVVAVDVALAIAVVGAAARTHIKCNAGIQRHRVHAQPTRSRTEGCACSCTSAIQVLKKRPRKPVAKRRPRRQPPMHKATTHKPQAISTTSASGGEKLAPPRRSVAIQPRETPSRSRTAGHARPKRARYRGMRQGMPHRRQAVPAAEHGRRSRERQQSLQQLLPHMPASRRATPTRRSGEAAFESANEATSTKKMDGQLRPHSPRNAAAQQRHPRKSHLVLILSWVEARTERRRDRRGSSAQQRQPGLHVGDGHSGAQCERDGQALRAPHRAHRHLFSHTHTRQHRTVRVSRSRRAASTPVRERTAHPQFTVEPVDGCACFGYARVCRRVGDAAAARSRVWQEKYLPAVAAVAGAAVAAKALDSKLKVSTDLHFLKAVVQMKLKSVNACCARATAWRLHLRC